MQELFEKIIENLEKQADELYKAYCIGFNSDDRAGYDAYVNAIEIVKQEAEQYTSTEHINCSSDSSTNGWIPCSEPPNDDRYVLLSFDNFSIPMVGRYEEDEKGCSYYIGDEMEPCVTQDIFVNAWQPLPAPYQPKGE